MVLGESRCQGYVLQKLQLRSGSHQNNFQSVFRKIRIEEGISHCHTVCAEVGVPFLFSRYFLHEALVLLSTHLSEVDIIDEVLMEGLGVGWRVESTAGISS